MSPFKIILGENITYINSISIKNNNIFYYHFFIKFKFSIDK